MTYSCAYFKSDGDTLERAQQNKFDHIARKLMLAPGDTLLDIGCGWGGLLLHCAGRYGIRGLGNTLSSNQYEYANRMIEQQGMRGRPSRLMEDYRDLAGNSINLYPSGCRTRCREFIPVYIKMCCC